MTDNEVPLRDDVKRMIIQAIHDGVNDGLDSFREGQVATGNSRPFLSWDMINTNLKNIPHWAIKPIKTRVNRGTWEFVPLYDESHSHLYVVMGLGRVRDLKKQLTNRRECHYLQQLCAVNGNGMATPRQMSLFDDVTREIKTDDAIIAREGTVSQLIMDLAPKKCITITFDRFERQITEVSAKILDSQLDESYNENWNDFIPADYSGMLPNEQGRTEELIDHEDEIDGMNLKRNRESANTENSTDSGVVQLKDHRKNDHADGVGLKKNETEWTTDDN